MIESASCSSLYILNSNTENNAKLVIFYELGSEGSKWPRNKSISGIITSRHTYVVLPFFIKRIYIHLKMYGTIEFLHF